MTSSEPLPRTLVALFLSSLLPCVTEGIADSLVVATTGGLVQGTIRQGTVRFLGLPYGTAQRFQFPTLSSTRQTGILNASQPGPQCPQRCPPVIRDLYCLPDHQMDETCLSLNVYRPAYKLRYGQAFPVMVFIHGGGFESGSGAAPLYNADFLARAGRMIVVTINYRLGAFGFLPIFNSYDDVIGNFGLRDQQVALQWVRQNIAAFDGDPNKVTLMGAEAGCQSVGLHLTFSASEPLFHSAILHSCPFTLPFRRKNESRQIARDFAAALGCEQNDVICMRQKPQQDILRAQDKISDRMSSRGPPSLRKLQTWGPIVDMRNVHDASLLEEMTNAYLRPNMAAHSKPVLLGMVSGEGRTGVYRNFPLPVSKNFFQRFIQSELPGSWRDVMESPGTPYYSGNNADARADMVRFLNDFVYTCPARKMAGQLAIRRQRSPGGAGKRQNVWLYIFDPQITLSPGGSAWPPGGEPYCRHDACQGLDLLYLFRPSSIIPESKRGATEGLTKAMISYWTNFVRYHNPNGDQSTSLPGASHPAHILHQGSLPAHLATGAGLALRHFSSSVTSSAPRNSGDSSSSSVSNIPSSLLRLIQTASSSFTGAASPRPGSVGQIQARFGIPRFRQSLGAGLSLASVIPQFRSRPLQTTPTAATTTSTWPTYFSTGSATSSKVNVTLVLTQPSPVARRSLFDSDCQFWDDIIFSRIV